jgi:hypothetical protein
MAPVSAPAMNPGRRLDEGELRVGGRYAGRSRLLDLSTRPGRWYWTPAQGRLDEVDLRAMDLALLLLDGRGR